MHAADRNLLFGLVALQNGLINQGQLVAAFQAWTLDKSRTLADHLEANGNLDTDDRGAVEALMARHLKRHGDDAEKSLAAVSAGKSTRESLARIGDPEIDRTLDHVGSASDVTLDQDADRTADYSVGTIPNFRADLAGSFISRALARRAQGDHAGAAGDLRRAMSLYDSLPSPRVADWFCLACARSAFSGEARFASSGVTAAEAAGAADAAMVALLRAVRMGTRNPHTFRTQEALDPLRNRPDFQLLVLDLAFPTDPFDRSN